MLFVPLIKNQFGVVIKKLRFHNATNYYIYALDYFSQKEGIILEYSSVYTPQQNVDAEWKNRHLLEQTRYLLIKNTRN